LERSTEGDITTLTMRHGPVNALDVELCDAITHAFGDVANDGTTRAVILRGGNGTFSAGVDLRRIVDEGPDYTRRFLPALSMVFEAVFSCPAPTVAAIDRHAIAGGAVLAMAADVVVAAADDRSRIGLTEMAVGVPFPAIAIEIARLRLGTALQRVVLGAAAYPPSVAADLGFVDHVVTTNELGSQTLGTARSLAAIPPETFRLAKRQIQHTARRAVAETGADWDAVVHDVWTSPEGHGAIAEFVGTTLDR
jgi:enoyl-CoA hydratase